MRTSFRLRHAAAKSKIRRSIQARCIVAGIGLIALGLLGLGGVAGVVVAVVGLVPLIAGVVDICVFAPLFSCPISGLKIRAGS
ncbi:MAG: hypothetical protein BMS9Abin28_1048 [Anaerolineae bacterium]|nr:MAG: hypothetical protein BMS9Abin28_1048 [Anaerolineae bacterium]